MKTKRLLVSLLFLGMLGTTSSVFAFQKEQFQGEFFNMRINTTVKKITPSILQALRLFH